MKVGGQVRALEARLAAERSRTEITREGLLYMGEELKRLRPKADQAEAEGEAVEEHLPVELGEKLAQITEGDGVLTLLFHRCCGTLEKPSELSLPGAAKATETEYRRLRAAVRKLEELGVADVESRGRQHQEWLVWRYPGREVVGAATNSIDAEGVDLERAVDLSDSDAEALIEGSSRGQLLGLELLAIEGPLVYAHQLSDAGIKDPARFQSRVNRRLREALGRDSGQVIVSDVDEYGSSQWSKFGISSATYEALRGALGFS